MAWKRTLRKDLGAGRDCVVRSGAQEPMIGGPASECLSLKAGVGLLVFRVSKRARAAGTGSSTVTKLADESREVTESQIA